MVTPMTLNTSSEPKIAVLLAAYNGMQWIEEQVDTILAQQGVDIRLYISVDLSTDDTLQWCEALAEKDSRVTVLPYGERFGGAAKNFYRLIHDVDFSGFDYMSLADQDDIWFDDKLKTACNTIVEQKCDVYSSNLLSFWKDGRQLLLDKMQAQRKYDYLFQGGGAGCTYVASAVSTQQFKQFLLDHWEEATAVNYHDWLMYSFCRSQGILWYFDKGYKLHYRQHENNEVGSNTGLTAAYKRLKLLRAGWYSTECLKIIKVLQKVSSDIPAQFLGKGFKNRIFLLRNISQLRRKFGERVFLFVIILIGLY